MSEGDAAMLRKQWTTIYSEVLPSLARTRDPAQPKWSVTLDHCFARIILDNTVGQGTRQWDTVINKPAVKNMSVQQLQAAIDLGEEIKCGTVDLTELDQISLKARGKDEKKYRNADDGTLKPASKRGTDEDEENGIRGQGQPSPHKKQKQSTLSFVSGVRGGGSKEVPQSLTNPRPETLMTDNILSDLLDKIANHPDLTPYRKRLYSTLLSVPLGCYTTYAAMAHYLNSSARAVGNGMRNNPFAPDVPCHRVLAADGSIGGFKGSWGKDGKYANHKITLLADEGVKFDSRGKVKGPVFTTLKDLSQDRTIKI